MRLTDYQKEIVNQAVQVIETHRLVYLALETRVGKTPISLMAANIIAERYKCPEIVFATKLSVIPSIKETIELLQEDYFVSKKITVTSFDSLHKIDWLPNRIIIADEAHSFGSYPTPSKRAVMLAGISRQCYVIYLSATPTPESYSQIYHQLWAAGSQSELIAPYRNFYSWAARYVDKKQKYISNSRTVVDYSHAKQELILPYLREFTITGTKEEAGFALTTVNEIILRPAMPEHLAEYIKQIKTEQYLKIGEHEIIADTAASVMSKHHQLCSGTVIAETGTLEVSDHKLKLLKMIQAAYPRIAIFYKYIGEFDALCGYYGNNWTADPEVFASDPSKVFLGQYLSKREGISLMAANAIVMYNIDFAYLSYEQTKNRIMNMYRTEPATLIWIFTQGGIEEKIYKSVCNKKNFTTSHYKRLK